MKYKKMSVFDLDRTLINCNSSYRFSSHLRRKKVLGNKDLLMSAYFFVQHSILGMPLKELHQKVFKSVLNGKSYPEFEKNAEVFVRHLLENCLYEPAVDALTRAIHLGHYTMILSSSPSFLVDPIAKDLGVSEWISSAYSVDNASRISGFSRLILGKDKAALMLDRAQELGIAPENIYAYSDSHLDLPLLEGAGNPVTVNPNRKLRKFARLNGWPVM